MATNAGAGRGGQGGPTAKQADQNRGMMSASERAARDQMAEEKFQKANEDAYNRTIEGKKKGGSISASKRADGIAERGKTRGTLVMCGGGMYKK